MEQRRNRITVFSLCVVFFIMIIDAKCTLAVANEAIELCLKSVIPSLFPLIFLSLIINSYLSGGGKKHVGVINRICAIPPGVQLLFLLGLLGGYPIGAKCVDQAYRDKEITKKDAQRLLGFCSNAGPAFILGFGSGVFENRAAPWCLWVIHVLSALIVGWITRRRCDPAVLANKARKDTITQLLENSIKITAMICGWVVILRIVIRFLERWILWILPLPMQIAISGALELVNGFHGLQHIPLPGVRFIMSSCFLGFGGVCVCLQTAAVTRNIGLGAYIPGKLLQTTISFFLSLILQRFLFPAQERWLPGIGVLSLFISGFFLITMYFFRKNGSIMNRNVV